MSIRDGMAACGRWADQGCDGMPVPRDEARQALSPDVPLLPLVHAAGTVRRHHHGDRVAIHVLDNVRNGACPEDCGYCGQSKDSTVPIKPFKLKPIDAIVTDAERAKAQGAYRFCMAMARRGPSDADIAHVCEAVHRIRGMGLRTCLSAGLLDEAKARRLKAAGLDRLNHNLNTSERHYPAICTTHTYRDRLQTLRAARTAGLGLCSGLIVGMGETHEDLLEVATVLQDIGAESIPVNFLLPIDGNRLDDPRSDGRPLDPQFVLRVLSMFRLTNPTAELRIAAGREHHLRTLQPLALWPANSLFMEGYLLTKGQHASDTLQMILDAGLVPHVEGQPPPALQDILGGSTTAEQGSTTGGPPLAADHLKEDVRALGPRAQSASSS